MARNIPTAAKGCLILAAIVVAIPLAIVGWVGVRTLVPLREASETLAELDRTLGADAAYVPGPAGEIPAERMEVFLELRTALVTACDDYGTVREGFDSVASLESKDPHDAREVGGVAADLGGASLSITPFLARYFALRNDALLAASMGLEEYAYIYATAYRDRLLSAQTRNEIFSDGDALSPEASLMLKGCLARQLETVDRSAADTTGRGLLESELRKMEEEPSRLIWQDGLPDPIQASVDPFRERLDRLFCGATAGLEMERDAGRALRVALE